MKIKPLHDWVVIRSTGPEERTAGGIIIPEIAKEKPQWGIVESSWAGRFEADKKDPKAKKKFVPTGVTVGDRVLYEKYMAREFTVDGQEVIMVRESAILGIIAGGGEEKGAGRAGSTELQKRGSGTLAKKGPSALQKKEHGAVAEVKKPAAKKNTTKK